MKVLVDGAESSIVAGGEEWGWEKVAQIRSAPDY
jgi:hypothetical protein